MIEEVAFANNDFHGSGIDLLFYILKELHMLKYLTLASNHAVNYMTDNIAIVIYGNFITHINLSNCVLKKNTCLPVLKALILQAPNLQHIDLSSNNLNNTANYVSKLISTNYLKCLILANTYINER